MRTLIHWSTTEIIRSRSRATRRTGRWPGKTDRLYANGRKRRRGHKELCFSCRQLYRGPLDKADKQRPAGAEYKAADRSEHRRSGDRSSQFLSPSNRKRSPMSSDAIFRHQGASFTFDAEQREHDGCARQCRLGRCRRRVFCDGGSARRAGRRASSISSDKVRVSDRTVPRRHHQLGHRQRKDQRDAASDHGPAADRGGRLGDEDLYRHQRIILLSRNTIASSSLPAPAGRSVSSISSISVIIGRCGFLQSRSAY